MPAPYVALAEGCLKKSPVHLPYGPEAHESQRPPPAEHFKERESWPVAVVGTMLVQKRLRRPHAVEHDDWLAQGLEVNDVRALSISRQIILLVKVAGGSRHTAGD